VREPRPGSPFRAKLACQPQPWLTSSLRFLSNLTLHVTQKFNHGLRCSILSHVLFLDTRHRQASADPGHRVQLTCLALYLTRGRWAHLVPISDYIYQHLPSSFSNDIESGFTSSDFDLSTNVAAGDSRAGLDQAGKREVQKIMKSRRVGFDEARRLYTEQRFAKNNIGPDGRPRDPKFVSFS